MSEAVLIAIITAVCSSGVTGLVTFFVQRHDKRHDKDSLLAKMVLGLGHDRLMFLCQKYIERGSISSDEYEDLYHYLYEPYLAMGGNGVVKRLMDEVLKLPVRKANHGK